MLGSDVSTKPFKKVITDNQHTKLLKRDLYKRQGSFNMW